jgi:6-phosphogluconolactonase
LSGVTLRVCPNVPATMRACAEAIASALGGAAQPQFVLAGGQTPRGVYQLLAGDGLPQGPAWQDVEFWFGDERCVGPDHPKSNYRMAREALFAPLGVASGRVHRMLGEFGADEGARRYRDRLLERLGAHPHFDALLAGMGPEGHTLSLFPGSPELLAQELAVATRVPTPPRERISLTPAACAGADRIFLLVTGREKRAALAAALEAFAPDPDTPTSFLRGRLETVCFCDQESAP